MQYIDLNAMNLYLLEKYCNCNNAEPMQVIADFETNYDLGNFLRGEVHD